MKRSMGLWQLLGFGVVSLGGTLLHFLYEWSSESLWTAPFSGVNESTWEHMKLLFFPLFVFAVVQFFFFREQADFWCVKLRGTLLGLVLIPILFYIYNGAIAKSPDWLNIAIFFIAAAATFLYETKRFQEGKLTCKHPRIAFGALTILALFFVLFTFVTPNLGIFRDPITGTLGL